MWILKLLGALLLVAVLVVVGSTAWLLTSQADVSAFDSAYAPPAEQPVTVRFFGTSSMLFSDGTTNLMIDGWFSRPSTLSVLLGEIEPDIQAIERGLANLGNPQVAALIPVHSHYDHAMDVAEVAKRNGALLVGSESTANIGRGGGLPETQIKVVEDGETLRFGSFEVTLIESNHYLFPNPAAAAGNAADLVIDEPLVPPVAAFDYRQGKAYSILIRHPQGSAMIQSSAGFKEGTLAGLDVDVAYVGVGGLMSQTENYQSTYWEEVVRMTKPEGIYPIHWDSFSHTITAEDTRPAAPNLFWNDLFGMSAAEGIGFALDRAKTDGLDSALLPLWQEVDAFRVRRGAGAGS